MTKITNKQINDIIKILTECRDMLIKLSGEMSPSEPPAPMKGISERPKPPVEKKS